eukprot:tig00000615_g2533.t1
MSSEVPALEICVDSVESALAADKKGADRLELCSALTEGGLTPSHGLLSLVTSRLPDADVVAMIRPRPGDFLYSPEEFEVMKKDLDHAKAAGARGFAVGILSADGRVDAARTAELVKMAAPLPVCFHRAFDLTRDPFEALEALVRIGVRRVLTSGQKESALAGAATIKALQEKAAGRIEVVAGAGITPGNVEEVVRATGVSQVHASARHAVPSKMEHRAPGVPMGRPGSDEYVRLVCDPEAVRSMRDKLNKL